MSKEIYLSIIKAVGSLPFWTGKRKLTRFLAGETGSFWNRESPLKRVYLEQRFFGSLSDYTASSIRQHLQKLQQSGYLYQGKISEDKPYKVIKFTGKGARKFYNTLVLDGGIETPFWWLHHVAQLQEPTRQPIATGGQLLHYNDTPYLTQTPPHAPLQQRIKEEKSLPLILETEAEFDDGHYGITGVGVDTSRGTHLVVTDASDVSTTTPKDLQEKLSHYDQPQSQVAPPNPYVIEGEVTSIQPGDETNTWLKLKLKNREDETLPVYLKRNQIPEQLNLDEGERYVLGPLTEFDHDETEGEQFELRLEDNGEIREQQL